MELPLRWEKREIISKEVSVHVAPYQTDIGHDEGRRPLSPGGLSTEMTLDLRPEYEQEPLSTSARDR